MELLKDLFAAAQHDSNEVLLFADPVHQVHNNEIAGNQKEAITQKQHWPIPAEGG